MENSKLFSRKSYVEKSFHEPIDGLFALVRCDEVIIKTNEILPLKCSLCKIMQSWVIRVP